MKTRTVTDYKPILVDVDDVPTRERPSLWRERFASLPQNKATRLEYKTRQRAFQVRASLNASARRLKQKIYSRIIHEIPPINAKDCWVVYFWRGDSIKIVEGKDG